MSRIEPSEGVESPLLARALIIDDHETKIVILDCDLLGFDLPLAKRIREEIANRLGTAPSHVSIGCTHTHNGPCTVRGILGGVHHVVIDQREVEALDQYIEDLVRRLVDLAAEADMNRQEARAAAGRTEAPIAINREELDPSDGRIVVGRNREGTTDHSVDVLRVDDLSGNPIAVLTSYAAHPVVMGPDTHQLSPDYPGVVRRIVEKITGATCLFLTGAAGNQATVSFLQNDWGEKERMGGIVGSAATKAFFDIETRPYREVRNRGKSLANIAFYHKEFLAIRGTQSLQVANREVSVPLQPLPSLEEAEAELVKSRSRVKQLIDNGAPSRESYPARMLEHWAEGVVNKVKTGITQETLTFPIAGYRLDNFVLATMPGEPFVEIGLAVKQRSRAQHTMFAGYCNGVLAYWPTDNTVRRGGMAVEGSVKTYNISAPPAEGTADIIVDEFGKLLHELGL